MVLGLGGLSLSLLVIGLTIATVKQQNVSSDSSSWDLFDGDDVFFDMGTPKENIVQDPEVTPVDNYGAYKIIQKQNEKPILPPLASLEPEPWRMLLHNLTSNKDNVLHRTLDGNHENPEDVEKAKSYAINTLNSTVLMELRNNVLRCPRSYGHFPDPEGNCSRFYLCRYNLHTLQECPLGLHFNPITYMCDYPEEAQCLHLCPQRYGKFPIASDCAKFLECRNGVGTVFSCTNGLHFNAITKQCDTLRKATCALTCPQFNTQLALPGRCNLYLHCTQGKATLEICPKKLHFDPINLACDKPQNAHCTVQCPKQEGLFPVPGQCSSYIQCHRGKPKVIACPSELHFNFLIRACDVPERAQCELKCKEPNSYAAVPGLCSLFVQCVKGIPKLQKCPIGLVFNPHTLQCNLQTRDSCMPKCPTADGLFPMLDNCDYFVHCSKGFANTKRCPLGLHYSTLIKSCELPANVKCKTKCPTPDGLFPVAGKCDIFFSCLNNVPTSHRCSKGHHFNTRTKSCDLPATSRCEILCPEFDGFYPVPGDDSSYIECNQGIPVLRTCVDGLEFNFKSGNCQYTKYLVCTRTNGRFRLPGFCNSYVDCLNGMGSTHSCPLGLLYNTRTKTCDFPDRVNCSESARNRVLRLLQ